MHYGPIPKGQNVCHHCDNRQCIRPDHFFLGTQKDNLRDASSKDRMSRGERHYKAKLTESKAASIREQFAAGKTTSELAKQFEVSSGAIHAVVTGYSWKPRE